MSGFEFGLQKVLDLREQREKEHARELADAERRMDAARERLEELRQIRDAEADKLVKSHGQSRRVGHVHNLTRAIQQLSERVHRAEAACREANADVEASRSELKEAMTDRQVLDTLREKKESAWHHERKNDEQRRMDELALTRFQRRDDNGGSR
jgi:flagellar FliJ protein